MDLHLKKGALHRALGVKKGEKIPPGALYNAAHSENPLERKRAQFAINAKKWHHGGVKSKKRKKMTVAEDKAYDRKHGIKEGSKKDIELDRKRGIKDKKRKSISKPDMMAMKRRR